MRIKVLGAMWQIDPLMLLFPILAALLGEGASAAALIASLFIHELAHAAAARLLHVGMSSVRLTPFGGMSRIENPYAISAPRIFAVAAAGPAANLLALLACGALFAHVPNAALAELMRANAVLMAFNLLPALPLDGGRMAYALLSAKLGRERALSACIWAGRALAAMLVALAAWGWFARGQLNLSPAFAAVFILASASDERRAMSDSRVESLIHAIRPLSEPTPAQVVAVDAAVPAEVALRSARPDRVTLYAVYQDGSLARFTDDRALTARLVKEKNSDPDLQKSGRKTDEKPRKYPRKSAAPDANAGSAGRKG